MFVVQHLLVPSGNWFFKVRDVLSPIVFLLLVVTTRPLWNFGDRRDVALIVTGTVVTLVGQTLRAAVIGYAYVKRGGKDRKVYAETLVQEGFFNHCRNPLYVGNVLVLLGLLIAYGSPVALALGAAFYAYLYLAITFAEEQYLRAKFKCAYEEYAQRVNRFVPDFRHLQRSLEGMRYDWPRLLRKEYGTVFAWFATLLCLIGWKAYLSNGRRLDPSLATYLSVVGMIGALLWATARILKKRGVLGTG